MDPSGAVVLGVAFDVAAAAEASGDISVASIGKRKMERAGGRVTEVTQESTFLSRFHQPVNDLFLRDVNIY